MADTDGNSVVPVDPFSLKPDFSQLDYAELMQLLDAGEVVHIRELDDTEVVEKENLIGIPMVITDWVRKMSDMGEYVVVRAATPNGKVVFADGSTGIKEQLIKFSIDGKPILVPKGLRKSDYTYKDEEGKAIPATTFYLDNSN